MHEAGRRTGGHGGAVIGIETTNHSDATLDLLARLGCTLAKVRFAADVAPLRAAGVTHAILRPGDDGMDATQAVQSLWELVQACLATGVTIVGIVPANEPNHHQSRWRDPAQWFDDYLLPVYNTIKEFRLPLISPPLAVLHDEGAWAPYIEPLSWWDFGGLHAYATATPAENPDALPFWERLQPPIQGRPTITLEVGDSRGGEWTEARADCLLELIAASHRFSAHVVLFAPDDPNWREGNPAGNPDFWPPDWVVDRIRNQTAETFQPPPPIEGSIPVESTVVSSSLEAKTMNQDDIENALNVLNGWATALGVERRWATARMRQAARELDDAAAVLREAAAPH